MEHRHESHFFGVAPPTYAHPCSRCDIPKETDGRRKAPRASEAERTGQLQVRRNSKGHQALGGRLHGGRAKTYPARRRDLDAVT